VDYFELTVQATVPSPGGGGGGGGTTTIIEKCAYNWDCTPWGVCSDGRQTRECKNIGTCTGIENKPIEEMNCSEVLFDVVLKLKDIKLTENGSLLFKVNLTEKIGVEKIDVHIKYSIINDDNYEIFGQIETKAVYEDLYYEKEIGEIDLVDGEYILRVDVLYGNLQRAFVEQRFEVRDGELFFLSESGWVVSKLLIIFGILIFVGILIAFVFVGLVGERKREGDSSIVHLGGVGRGLKRVGVENKLVIIFVLVVLGFLFVIRKSITGFIIGDLVVWRSGWLVFIVAIIVIVLSAFLFRNRIKVFIVSFIGRIKPKYSKGSISGLIRKKVYTAEGDYVGRVIGVVLGDGVIDSLEIRLKKRKEISVKGIVVKYKEVKGVGRVVIIDGRVLEKVSKV